MACTLLMPQGPHNRLGTALVSTEGTLGDFLSDDSLLLATQAVFLLATGRQAGSLGKTEAFPEGESVTSSLEDLLTWGKIKIKKENSNNEA